MQSITFLVIENNGQIPSYNVIPRNPLTGERDDPNESRGRNIEKLFPSHGKTIISLDQIQNYKYSDSKGLTPEDPQFPLLPDPPGMNSWFIDPSEPRVDLSVYECDTDEYTNSFYGYSGKELTHLTL